MGESSRSCATWSTARSLNSGEPLWFNCELLEAARVSHVACGSGLSEKRCISCATISSSALEGSGATTSGGLSSFSSSSVLSERRECLGHERLLLANGNTCALLSAVAAGIGFGVKLFEALEMLAVAVTMAVAEAARSKVDELKPAVLCCRNLDFLPGDLAFVFAGLSRFCGDLVAFEVAAVFASGTTRALADAPLAPAPRLHLSLNVWRTSSSLNDRVARSRTRRHSHTPALGASALPSNELLGASGVAPGVMSWAFGSSELALVGAPTLSVLSTPASDAAIALAGLKSYLESKMNAPCVECRALPT